MKSERIDIADYLAAEAIRECDRGHYYTAEVLEEISHKVRQRIYKGAAEMQGGGE